MNISLDLHGLIFILYWEEILLVILVKLSIIMILIMDIGFLANKIKLKWINQLYLEVNSQKSKELSYVLWTGILSLNFGN